MYLNIIENINYNMWSINTLRYSLWGISCVSLSELKTLGKVGIRSICSACEYMEQQRERQNLEDEEVTRGTQWNIHTQLSEGTVCNDCRWHSGYFTCNLSFTVLQTTIWVSQFLKKNPKKHVIFYVVLPTAFSLRNVVGGSCCHQ